jgi:hypothetical protein
MVLDASYLAPGGRQAPATTQVSLGLDEADAL